MLANAKQAKPMARLTMLTVDCRRYFTSCRQARVRLCSIIIQAPSSSPKGGGFRELLVSFILCLFISSSNFYSSLDWELRFLYRGNKVPVVGKQGFSLLQTVFPLPKLFFLENSVFSP